MTVAHFTDNLLLKPFLERCVEPGATVIVEALADTTLRKGVVRGCWVFGLKISSQQEEKCFKLVTSSSAQIAKIATLDGVFSKIQSLGFSHVKIPRLAGEQILYTSERHTP